MSWVCLMYHDVQPDVRASGGGLERFSTPLSAFESMLDVIVTNGYRGCSVTEAMQAPGTPRVAVSFDDGTLGQFEHALPALLSRGMTATYFVTTDWIGESGFMTWDHLRELKSRGMSVESHTKSHPFLSELDETELRRELGDSKTQLDNELAQNTKAISFPGGNQPRWRLRHVTGDVGYDIIAGSRWGANPDRRDSRLLRRCTMRGAVSPDIASRIIAGDARLTMLRYPREAFLNGIRSAIGASRYARLRRNFLDMVDAE